MSVDHGQARTIFGAFKEVGHRAVDPDLFARVQDYKRRVASKFKSIALEGLEKIQGNEFFASLKLDGEHAHLYYEEGRAYLIKPRLFSYFGLPCLDEAAELFQRADVKRALIPGELYAVAEDGSRTRVFDVISLVKKPRGEEDLMRLRFSPFDIITLDDEVFVDFAEVVDRLQQLFGDTNLAPPPLIVTKEPREIATFYDHWVNKHGAEGLMIRSDLTFRYKLKAQHTIDAAIIGYTAENEMVSSVLTALLTPEGHFHVLTAVEKGFSDVERMMLYQKLSQSHAESEFMEVSRFHTPFHMVKPKLIIEFSTNDMITEHHNGAPIKKAVLDLRKGKYRITRSAPLVSLMHRVFIRFREDKEINPVDLRTAQVTDYVFVDLSEKSSRKIEFPEVEILKREVYFKQTGDKLAVRKFLVWKTNKEEMDSAYSAYAFNYTDYSPGRKEPLQQDVRISNSRDQIMAIADEFMVKGVKKGWQRAEPET